MKKHEGTLSSTNSLEAKVEDLSDSDLVSLLSSLRSKPDPSKELETTFAVAREAAWRTLQLRPYDVQVLGGLTLHSSKVCQMATGEGKTLTTIFPALQAWVEGRGSFIVTTNDYLAKRDAGILRPAFEFLGLSVGLIQTDMKEEVRECARSERRRLRRYTNSPPPLLTQQTTLGAQNPVPEGRRLRHQL